MKFFTYRLWILILTVALVQIDVEVRKLDQSSPFTFLLGCIILFLICYLFDLALWCLMSMGIVFLILIVVALVDRKKYAQVFFIVVSLISLCSREKDIAPRVRILFIGFNITVLLDIIRH